MPTSSAPADAASMSGMDHSKMNMSDMNHSTMIKSGQDHGAMNLMSTTPARPTEAMPGMNHGQTNTTPTGTSHDMGAMDTSGGEMDHGDMQMQGGSAPADARDPDAYSNGYVRNAGKYALPPSEALIMSDMHNFGSVNFDRLEYVRARGKEWTAYEGEAWYGSTDRKSVV